MRRARGGALAAPVPLLAASLLVAALCVLPLVVVVATSVEVGWAAAWALRHTKRYC